MTELSFTKQFLSTLSSRPIRTNADFCEDARKLPARTPVHPLTHPSVYPKLTNENPVHPPQNRKAKVQKGPPRLLLHLSHPDRKNNPSLPPRRLDNPPPPRNAPIHEHNLAEASIIHGEQDTNRKDQVIAEG